MHKITLMHGLKKMILIAKVQRPFFVKVHIWRGLADV